MTSAELNKFIKNPGLLNEQTLFITENLTLDFPAFDIGWALWIRNLKNIDEDSFQKNLPEVAIRISDRKWLKKFLDTQAPGTQTDIGSSDYLSIADYSIESEGQDDVVSENQQGNNMSLIENFLASGGDFNMKTMNSVDSTSSDLAEKAVTENYDIVTETFANILMSQGKLQKALEAFEKLSLKYPEKSIYFAARIEEVKSLLNR
jgi:hypothetical protein